MTYFKDDRRTERLVVLILAVFTLIIYWPMLTNGFIDLDDNMYITANPMVQAGITLRGARWAFTTFYFQLWSPITWLSFMLDCQFYGLHAWGHHFTSLVLHTANAVLLFLWLRRITGSMEKSLIAAFLFAIHPLRVESVAYASERKDVLSGFFWMTTLWAYYYYTKAPSWKRYVVTLAMYALDLMSKPMVVTLPVVLLLLDFWPLDRFKRNSFVRLVVEKLPFGALAVVVSILTVLAQRSMILPQSSYPLPWRIGAAGVFYCEYIGKIFWPQNLGLYYSHPGILLRPWQMAAAWIFIAVVSGWVVLLRKRYSYLLVGWFWFLATLLPVIGLVQITGRAIADRFTYLPQIGLNILICWGCFNLARKKTAAVAFWRMAFVIILALLAWRTHDQLHYWSDPSLLYEHTLEISPNNELLRNIWGVYLARHGETAKAEIQLHEALRLNPKYADALNNLGYLLECEGRKAEAAVEYQKALEANPDHEKARRSLDRLKGVKSSKPTQQQADGSASQQTEPD